jgi:hypothetical protein
MKPRQFMCERCGRLISELPLPQWRPGDPYVLPAVEFIESCAICAKLPAPSTTR